MTIHKLLMSLSPWQIADSSCMHWSPSIWPLMGWIKKTTTTTHTLTHIQSLLGAYKATEMLEGDWTGRNTVKYMLSLMSWIISIDIYLRPWYRLIKAVWNKPALWMIGSAMKRWNTRRLEAFFFFFCKAFKWLSLWLRTAAGKKLIFRISQPLGFSARQGEAPPDAPSDY